MALGLESISAVIAARLMMTLASPALASGEVSSPASMSCLICRQNSSGAWRRPRRSCANSG